MNTLTKFLIVVATFTGCLQALRADIIVEDFNSPAGAEGRIFFDTDIVYDGITDAEVPAASGADFNGGPFLNGQITNGIGTISTDQSGFGFFLFGVSGGGTTSGQVWGTPTPIPVTTNTDYTLSFYLSNLNTINNALIEPSVNGQSLGSAVSAGGVGTWQQFSFPWNSGLNTTADLSLFNQRNTAFGNDFGLDTIAFTPVTVPEPNSLILLGIGLLATMTRSRVRRCRTAVTK